MFLCWGLTLGHVSATLTHGSELLGVTTSATALLMLVWFVVHSARRSRRLARQAVATVLWLEQRLGQTGSRWSSLLAICTQSYADAYALTYRVPLSRIETPKHASKEFSSLKALDAVETAEEQRKSRRQEREVRCGEQRDWLCWLRLTSPRRCGWRPPPRHTHDSCTSRFR